MKSIASLLLVIFIATTVLAQSTGTIFIVRHAEKQSDADDTPLSARGTARAQCLATTLRDAHVTSIIVSQYQRTRQTAAPLLAASRAAESAIPAKSYDQIAGAARTAAQSGNVLVVGHSNTIPSLLHTLGAPSVTIADTDYDQFFLLDARDPRRLTTLRYCTELPADTSSNRNMAK